MRFLRGQLSVKLLRKKCYAPSEPPLSLIFSATENFFSSSVGFLDFPNFLNTNKACPGDWLYQRHNVIMDEVNSRLANANGGTKNNESEVLEMNITKDELKAMIRETVVEVYNELNPLYEDIKDVPGYWKGTAQKLLDAEAVNGGTSKEVCATDLNLRRETLKAAIIASLYHDYEESEGAERE